MTKYLSLPCPYTNCQKTTVIKDTLICESCKRKAGRKVYTRKDDIPVFQLYPLGRRKGQETFMLSKRVPIVYEGITTQDVILALDTALEMGIICNTERAKT